MNELSHLGLDEDGEPVKKGKGCLFWGCLTVTICGLLIFLGVIAASYFVLGKVDEALSRLEPLVVAERPEMDIPEVDQELVATFTKDIKAFFDSCRAKEEASLTLSEATLDSVITNYGENVQTVWKRGGVDPKELAISVDLDKPFLNVEVAIGLSSLSDIDFLGLLGKHQLLDKYIHSSIKLKPDTVEGTPGLYIIKMVLHGKDQDVTVAQQMESGDYLFIDFDRLEEAEGAEELVRCVSSLKVSDEGLELSYKP